MYISTDFIDVVEDLLIFILLVVFIYLVYYNFFRKGAEKEKNEAVEPVEQKLFEIDMREEGLNQKRKSIEKEIEDKKKDYLKGRVERGDYQGFLRSKHAELVSLKSKLRK